jgi:hypothetical protein
VNPNLDPRVVGPIAAAGNLYWAVACVPLSASIWAVGVGVRLERGLRQAREREQ